MAATLNRAPEEEQVPFIFSVIPCDRLMSKDTPGPMPTESQTGLQPPPPSLQHCSPSTAQASALNNCSTALPGRCHGTHQFSSWILSFLNQRVFLPLFLMFPFLGTDLHKNTVLARGGGSHLQTQHSGRPTWMDCLSPGR